MGSVFLNFVFYTWQNSFYLLLKLLNYGFNFHTGYLHITILDIGCGIYDIACGDFVHLTTRKNLFGSSSALAQTPFPDCFVLFALILYLFSNFVLNLYL